MTIQYEWDPAKALSNQRKHGVRFADAISVLEDLLARTMEDEGALERRFVTIGRDVSGRLLVVIYTWRLNRIRLISARRATRREQSDYEEER